MTTLSTARRHRIGDGKAMQGWSDLPDGPLHTILTSMCSLVDFISFSSMCRSWRAFASSLSSSQITSLFPPLLLCPAFSFSRLISSLCLLDPTSPSFSSMLSRTSNKFTYVGFDSYSHGHLLYLSENRFVILNPFTSHELCSPCLPKGRKIFSSLLMLTSPLPSQDSGILLYASSSLFYWRIGSPLWSCHHCPRVIPGAEMTVVTMQGKVFAMDSLDTLYELELSPKLHLRIYELELSPKLHLRSLAVEGFALLSFSIWHSLVDCGGELLYLQLVAAEVVLSVVTSAQLQAFWLDLSVNEMRWVKKEILGNWAIFVGCNRRVPDIVVEKTERWGGRSNCVYFATRKANGDLPWATITLGYKIDTRKPESPLYIGTFEHQLSSAWAHPDFYEIS